MIQIERLNGQNVIVNPDLIRIIESAPDTILHFIDGQQILVKTKPDEIIRRIIEYRKMYLGVPQVK